MNLFLLYLHIAVTGLVSWILFQTLAIMTAAHMPTWVGHMLAIFLQLVAIALLVFYELTYLSMCCSQ